MNEIQNRLHHTEADSKQNHLERNIDELQQRNEDYDGSSFGLVGRWATTPFVCGSRPLLWRPPVPRLGAPPSLGFRLAFNKKEEGPGPSDPGTSLRPNAREPSGRPLT